MDNETEVQKILRVDRDNDCNRNRSSRCRRFYYFFVCAAAADLDGDVLGAVVEVPIVSLARS